MNEPNRYVHPLKKNNLVEGKPKGFLGFFRSKKKNEIEKIIVFSILVFSHIMCNNPNFTKKPDD